jgi:hypothetical protein
MGTGETFITETGQRIANVHPRDKCSGGNCPIHNPSEHYLAEAPRHWVGSKMLMERICEHGVHHPDPDALAHLARVYGAVTAAQAGVHTCDGCCTRPPKPELKLSTSRDRLSPLAL